MEQFIKDIKKLGFYKYSDELNLYRKNYLHDYDDGEQNCTMYILAFIKDGLCYVGYDSIEGGTNDIKFGNAYKEDLNLKCKTIEGLKRHANAIIKDFNDNIFDNVIEEKRR